MGKAEANKQVIKLKRMFTKKRIQKSYLKKRKNRNAFANLSAFVILKHLRPPGTSSIATTSNMCFLNLLNT